MKRLENLKVANIQEMYIYFLLPKPSTSADNRRLWTWQMNGSQNQIDCSDSSNGIAYKDLSSSQSQVAWA